MRECHLSPSQPIEQLQIVGRDKQRYTDFVESLEQFHDFERQFRVQIAGRLVGNHQWRSGYHRPGDTDALLFAGRQGNRVLLFFLEQTDLIERCPHPPPGFTVPEALNYKRQRNVVVHRPVMEQLVVLEDHADVAPEAGDAAPADTVCILTIDDDLASRRPLDQGDEPQQGALAGPRVSGQEHHLTALYVKTDLR